MRKKKPCLVAEKTEKKSEVLENMENPDEALSFESLLLTQNDEKRVTFGSAGGSVQCTEDWKNWVSLILSNQTRFQTKQWMELFEIGMRERERETAYKVDMGFWWIKICEGEKKVCFILCA